MSSHDAIPLALDAEETSPARQCRFCLECDEDPSDPLIAPCRCKGTSKWVHRSCLNQWRASNTRPTAFTHCTECQFEYHLEVQALHDDSDAARRRRKFRLLIARDFAMVFFAVQVCIVLLSCVVYAVDDASKIRIENDDGSESWEPPIRYFLFSDAYFGESTKTVYYICGFTLFLALIGFVGCCAKACGSGDPDEWTDFVCTPCFCSSRRRRRRHHRSTYYGDRVVFVHDDCCFWCCYDCCSGPSSSSRRHEDCDGCCSSSSSDGCNNSCSDSDGGPGALLIIVVVLVLFFAVVGVVYGLVMASAVAQRVTQRHMYVLQRRVLAKDYKVKDLSESYPLLTAEEIEIDDDALPTAPDFPKDELIALKII